MTIRGKANEMGKNRHSPRLVNLSIIVVMGIKSYMTFKLVLLRGYPLSLSMCLSGFLL
jgi:hypothetical protein